MRSEPEMSTELGQSSGQATQRLLSAACTRATVFLTMGHLTKRVLRYLCWYIHMLVCTGMYCRLVADRVAAKKLGFVYKSNML